MWCSVQEYLDIKVKLHWFDFVVDLSETKLCDKSTTSQKSETSSTSNVNWSTKKLKHLDMSRCCRLVYDSAWNSRYWLNKSATQSTTNSNQWSFPLNANWNQFIFLSLSVNEDPLNYLHPVFVLPLLTNSNFIISPVHHLKHILFFEFKHLKFLHLNTKLLRNK